MNLRYEEYIYELRMVPFILNENIKRTATLCSENQNWHENIEIQFCKEGDVLSYALFEQVALKFFEYRKAKKYGLDDNADAALGIHNA